MYGLCTGSNTVLIEKVGDCLFRAVSYGVYNTENRHSEMRYRARLTK